MARRRKKQTEIPETLLPTGCTILNCILADNAFGGLRKGTIINLIGDSSAGKSILSWTIIAAMIAEGYDSSYDFYYDDAEAAGDSFDLEKLFGEKTKSIVKPPRTDGNGEPVCSDTIEDFHMHIKDVLKNNKPFIYILDSFDSLDAEADREKLDKALKARKNGNKSSGSYGTAKSRKSSDILRNIRMEIKNTNSVLIIVSQIRDNLNAMAFGSKKTRSGGKALKHYSWHELWLYLGKKIKSKDRMVGVQTMPKIGKNRQTGKIRDGVFNIYYDLGIDDVEANVDFLLAEGYWKKRKQTIVAEELNLEGTKAKLIQQIEENNLEKQLQHCVQKCWTRIEESLKMDRKKRFK